MSKSSLINRFYWGGVFSFCNSPPIRIYYTSLEGYRDEWNDGNRSIFLSLPVPFTDFNWSLSTHATRKAESWGRVTPLGIWDSCLGKQRTHISICEGDPRGSFPWIILIDAIYQYSQSYIACFCLACDMLNQSH